MKTLPFLFHLLVLFISYSVICLKAEEVAINPVLIYNVSNITEEWGGGISMDQILLLNITKLNKRWDNFNYEEFQRPGYGGMNVESKENLKILRNETILLASEIISWYSKSRKRQSIFEKNEDLLFEVSLLSFNEEITSDSFNSPIAKIYIEINLRNRKVPFKSSIPFKLVKFKGDVEHWKISCPVISVNYFYFLSERNEFYKRKIDSLDCRVTLNSDSGQSYAAIERKIKIELDCIKNFTAFPFDFMECKYWLLLHMDFIDSTKINYIVRQKYFEPKINTYDYYLEDIITTNITSIRHYNRITWKLRRKHGYYIYTIYLPISLLVFVSWLSFFLGTSYSDVQMRLGLVVTILLTLITVIQGINNFVPKSPQYKASDHWCITSVGFVIAVIMVIVANRVLLWCKNKKSRTALDKETKRHRNDDKNQGLCIEEVGDLDVKVSMNFRQKLGLCTRDSIIWAKNKAKTLRSRKSQCCARIMNICAAAIFPLIYSYFVFSHIEKYCSWEKFWDNKYFESVTDYQIERQKGSLLWWPVTSR